MSERRSKYHAQPVERDGIRFDSKAEAARYWVLKFMERAGQITDLTPHPRFVVWEGVDSAGKREKITYEGDFSYMEGGRLVVEDIKGGKATQTQVWRMKRKMFVCMFPDIDFRVVEE